MFRKVLYGNDEFVMFVIVINKDKFMLCLEILRWYGDIKYERFIL